MKLSILVPTVLGRYNTFLPKILDQLNSQYNLLSEKDKENVEILCLLDNKTIMLGSKRNYLVDIANGDYVVHVDDDDILSENYISTLLESTYINKDVITFTAMVSLNDGLPKPCYYSKDFKIDSNEPSCYKRIPNHICCIKRDIAKRVDFPDVVYGEDSAFSKSVLPLLKTEYKIDKVLYHYNYNESTTETQKLIERKNDRLHKEGNFFMDVVILSNAKNDKLRRMTNRTIDSIIATTKGYILNIIVVEQNPFVFYKKVNTVHLTEPFNYNKFANIGVNKGNSEWIMVANNDLIFVKGWLEKLLDAKSPVVSPRCRRDHRQKAIWTNTSGYVNVVNFSGWCFMLKRYIWEEIGGFDEEFYFWFADDSFLEQLKNINIPSTLVYDSHVNHLGSTTLKTVDKQQMNHLTWEQVKRFNEKYNRDKFIDNPEYNKWLSENKGS